MKQSMIVALLAVMAALLLAGGAVLAKDLFCAGGECQGTKRADFIVGITGADRIAGRGGNDRIFGDGFGAGDDEVRGGAGDDVINDGVVTGPDTDLVLGGRGDDFVSVQERDQTVDVVGCGPGTDTVVFDGAFDQVASDCEIQRGA